MNYASYEDVKNIVTGMAKKIPHGVMLGNTTVGHIEWQMYLQRDYLKLDGTALANASNDYKELYEFAQDNNLITDNNKEDNNSHDKEVDDGHHEVAPADGDFPVKQHQRHVREVGADQASDDGADDIRHQGVDDRLEGCADDHTDCHVKDIAL